jgi:hypothetical protein
MANDGSAALIRCALLWIAAAILGSRKKAMLTSRQLAEIPIVERLYRKRRRWRAKIKLNFWQRFHGGDLRYTRNCNQFRVGLASGRVGSWLKSPHDDLAVEPRSRVNERNGDVATTIVKDSEGERNCSGLNNSVDDLGAAEAFQCFRFAQWTERHR